MKFTEVLYKRSLAFGWRRLWGSKRVKYPDYPVRLPKAYIDNPVELIDTGKEPKREKWHPPVADPRYYDPPAKHELGNYNEEQAFVCPPKICIHQGLEQAALLAKARVQRGLPPAVQRIFDKVENPEYTNTLLQRYIMQAQYWNTTKEKLPYRFDPRKPIWKFQTRYGIPPKMQAGILIRNLLRLCQHQVSQYPNLTDRRHISVPYINSHYYYKGQPVVVRGSAEWLITSSKPLPSFAEEEAVDATVGQGLPDLFPILPTIDLLPDHNYTLDHDLGMAKDMTHGHLHTLVLTDNNHFKVEPRMARDVLFCLGYTVAQAKRLYGDATHLPKPLSMQCVSLDHQTLNFVFFQLNTLDFSSEHGVKNLVWADGGNHLFQKILSQPWMPKAIRDERLEDLEPAVFRKLLAVYLNGASELLV